MNFDLTDEQKMIRDMARNFANEVISPRAEEMESSGEYPYDIVSKMAELGIIGIPFPEEYGGSNGDWVGMHLCFEEIARGDITMALCLVASSCNVAQEIFVFGNEEQKKQWMVPIVKGDEITAFALTEPYSGSDAKALKTRAIMHGDTWVSMAPNNLLPISDWIMPQPSW